MMIRLGIIGSGRIAKRAVKELQHVEGIAVRAVLNPNIIHAEAFAKENSIQEWFDNSTEFFNAIDAVYIASPHGTHYEYSKDALKNKKHVLCEKPMSFDKDQVKELLEVADKNNVVLMEGIKTNFCPGFKKLCEVIEQGRIGEVVDVEAAFTRLTADGCREFSDSAYGGAFTEFGSYSLLPIIRFLGTDYRNISFFSIPSADYSDSVDGYTKAFLDYGNKCGTGKAGLTVKSEGQLLISGTKGYILVPSPWWLTRYFEVRYEDPSSVEKYEIEYEGDGLRYEFSEFVLRIESDLTLSGNIENIELVREREEIMARAEVMGEFLSKRKK